MMRLAAQKLQLVASRLAGCRTSRAGAASFNAVQRAAHRVAGRAPREAAARWPARRPVARASAAHEAGPDGSTSRPGYEADLQLPTHCSGCGVELQQEEPEAPGFFQVPKRLLEQLAAEGDLDGAGLEEDDSELVFDDVGLEADEAGAEAAAGQEQAGVAGEAAAGPGEVQEAASTSGRDPEEEAKWAAFDEMVESWLGGSKPARVEVASYAEQEEGQGTGGSSVLCARCFSLRHYGSVKSEAAEAELPAFDFERRVGLKIQLQKFRRSVVLCVVDVADFDGSLPRQALRSILPPDLQQGPLDVGRPLPLGFRLLVAVNKADLLPKQVTPARLEKWVRRRMAQAGLPRPSAVHVVSSTKQRGVRELLSDLQAAVGVRGDVWVVGAQNAGKSSLINAMRQVARLPRDKDVTTAPLPGTTLGMLRVTGLLPTGCKMLDTPGVPHAHQLSGHLTADEMRMVLPRRQLKPRTFRIGAGQTVMIGGLARVDVVDSPGATLYLSVFASDEIVCHLGKTETAEERYAMHAGGKLCPPLGGEQRMAAFPPLRPTEVTAEGDSWKASSKDVAIAGLGWVGVGVSGTAALRVWAPPGVAVTTHDALVPDYARDLERPGFGVALTEVGKNRREEEARQFKAAKQQQRKGRQGAKRAAAAGS